MHSELTDYDVYDSTDEENYTDYPYEPQDDDYYHEDNYSDDAVEQYAHGGQRVIRLGLLLMVLLLIAAVIIFGVIPYVQTMSNHAPPLLPPVQA